MYSLCLHLLLCTNRSRGMNALNTSPQTLYWITTPTGPFVPPLPMPLFPTTWYFLYLWEWMHISKELYAFCKHFPAPLSCKMTHINQPTLGTLIELPSPRNRNCWGKLKASLQTHIYSTNHRPILFKFEHAPESFGGLVRKQNATSQILGALGLGWDLRFSIFRKFPDVVTGQENTR